MTNFLKGEDGNNLRFYWEARENRNRSAAAGRPQFDRALFVEIVPPGQPRSTVVHELLVEIRESEEAEVKTVTKRQDIIDRYRPAFKAFMEDGDEARIDGVPLEMYPLLGVTQRAELKAMHIHTVEQLAMMSDNAMSDFGMGARKMVEQARAYIEATSSTAPLTKLQAENDSMAEQLKAQDNQIAEMRRQLDALQANQPAADAPAGRQRKTKAA